MYLIKQAHTAPLGICQLKAYHNEQDITEALKKDLIALVGTITIKDNRWALIGEPIGFCLTAAGKLILDKYLKGKKCYKK